MPDSILATDVDGVREVVVHDQTGYLVPRGDTQLLAGKLACLLSDARLRARSGSAGRAVMSASSRTAMLDKIAAVYRGAVPGFERSRAASQSA